MKATTVLAALASFATLSSAAPAAASADGQLDRRWGSVKVTTCAHPNLENCDTFHTKIHTCFQLSHFQPESLSTHGRVCDFYPEIGCVGKRTKYWGTKKSLPKNLKFKSASCW